MVLIKQKKMDMKDRLLKFLNQEQLTSARFAEVIGVQPSSISHILSGRNKPGFDFIQKILTSYPSLSAEWLILGRGPVYKPQNIQRDLFSETQVNQPVQSKDDDDVQDIQEESSDVYTNVNSNLNEGGYISNSDNKKQITDVITRKGIERIVIFYSDKTFSEYFPGL